jgi:hypothetical protein
MWSPRREISDGILVEDYRDLSSYFPILTSEAFASDKNRIRRGEMRSGGGRQISLLVGPNVNARIWDEKGSSQISLLVGPGTHKPD